MRKSISELELSPIFAPLAHTRQLQLHMLMQAISPVRMHMRLSASGD
jgi:hypothetical protein